MPRHPSCALSSLTTKKQINFVLQSLNISCLSNCKLLCNPSSCRLLTNLFFNCQSTPRSLADFSLNNQVNLYLRVKLVGVLGFEPRTSSLSGTRSNQLSYTPAGSTRKTIASSMSFGLNRSYLGGAEGARTLDILLAKQVL